jgi:hypothetical protein
MGEGVSVGFAVLVGDKAPVNVGFAVKGFVKPQADKANPKDAVPPTFRKSRRDTRMGFESFIRSPYKCEALL